MSQPNNNDDYHTTIYLDPQHIFCNNGRTFLTCRSCAGNPPSCEDCRGNGFNTYICGHCQKASISDQERIGLFTTSPLATGPPTLKSSRPSSPESSVSSVSSLDRLPKPRNLDPPEHGHRR
ncbi:hypothetical protein TEQG_06698 [Trichophyton equinum CBS 127.97]|uniref:Uncharacterized protein n=1 Tax=Trichophyton equinum (strain ATCC MYA-4606 / CBS 127.97) TaxID=559882 RepID=F2Q0P7_TRIEC|nr:hypothetical protein TEQG_06698 [Trichophyton equinum CBS 127.97]